MGQPEGVFAAPHLVCDEVVAQGIQAAGDVGQTHGDLYEEADAGLGVAVLNHFLVHLKMVTNKAVITVLPYVHDDLTIAQGDIFARRLHGSIIEILPLILQ